MSTVEAEPEVHQQKEGGEPQQLQEQEQNQEEQPILNWQAVVAPYQLLFKVGPGQNLHTANNKQNCFFDAYGNFIDFEHTEPYAFKPVVKFLQARTAGSVEIEADRGSCAYTLVCPPEGYFVLVETRIGHNGWCGRFMSFVVVPTLEPLIEKLDSLFTAEDEYD